MTMSTHRSRLIWSPLVGWALLSTGVTAASAQTATPAPTQAQPDPGTTGATPAADQAPTVPPGGAVAPIVTPFGVPGTARPGSTIATPDPTLVAPSVPSAGTTIVNAPFGSSVPYYGGIIGLGTSNTTISGGPPNEDIGYSLGAFTLVPQLEINFGSDSNVFAENITPSRSLYTTVSPTLDLKSEWLNHALHVLANATYGWYFTAPTQNFQNYSLIVDGKVDIHSDMYATASTGYRRQTEALGTPNVAIAQSPTVVDMVPLELGFRQEFNDVFYQLGAKATRYWYTDNSVVSAGSLPAASRNRLEYAESLRVGYHLNEDLDIFVAPSFNQVRYIEQTNSAGQRRDSTGSNFSVGATWRVNPISILEGEFGYQTTNYGSGLGADSNLSWGLKGIYTGYAPLTLRPTISRSTNETALSNYKNYVSTTFAVDVTYLIHDAWTLAGGALVTKADYNPVDGSGFSPRTDWFMRGQIGLLYSIKPEVQIGPFYEYSRGTSTDPAGTNYDRQIFSIRLIAKR
jgi:hypothetical protein